MSLPASGCGAGDSTPERYSLRLSPQQATPKRVGVQLFGLEDTGAKSKELCCKHEISEATFYTWKARY